MLQSLAVVAYTIKKTKKTKPLNSIETVEIAKLISSQQTKNNDTNEDVDGKRKGSDRDSEQTSDEEITQEQDEVVSERTIESDSEEPIAEEMMLFEVAYNRDQHVPVEEATI
ncbi:uncharacterized protein B0P05DRAFT_587366 [Gilbertella persicaria]|uniref:uncharacterized protein n=1 Tax=Gilbertella persicaria TaxID=101096 RepID=UPI00221E9D16|nr:uncharacterized protein B0P05DRAFT_587366 [Gilbertella persicaria]KAI8078121.1 hypothetical protein B0P05DRAFT_587366 [Gilbertella persicaria]